MYYVVLYDNLGYVSWYDGPMPLWEAEELRAEIEGDNEESAGIIREDKFELIMC